MSEINLEWDGLDGPISNDEPPTDPQRRVTCPGCLGKGRYVGLSRVEDPCSYCGGSGEIPSETSFADL